MNIVCERTNEIAYTSQQLFNNSKSYFIFLILGKKENNEHCNERRESKDIISATFNCNIINTIENIQLEKEDAKDISVSNVNTRRKSSTTVEHNLKTSPKQFYSPRKNLSVSTFKGYYSPDQKYMKEMYDLVYHDDEELNKNSLNIFMMKVMNENDRRRSEDTLMKYKKLK